MERKQKVMKRKQKVVKRTKSDKGTKSDETKQKVMKWNKKQ